MKFAIKGNTSPQVHAGHSSAKLEIKGRFHVSGCQIVGGDGGAPQWVFDIFNDYPEIEEIAINFSDSGVVYAPHKPQVVKP